MRDICGSRRDCFSVGIVDTWVYKSLSRAHLFLFSSLPLPIRYLIPSSLPRHYLFATSYLPHLFLFLATTSSPPPSSPPPPYAINALYLPSISHFGSIYPDQFSTGRPYMNFEFIHISRTDKTLSLGNFFKNGQDSFTWQFFLGTIASTYRNKKMSAPILPVGVGIGGAGSGGNGGVPKKKGGRMVKGNRGHRGRMELTRSREAILEKMGLPLDMDLNIALPMEIRRTEQLGDGAIHKLWSLYKAHSPSDMHLLLLNQCRRPDGSYEVLQTFHVNGIKKALGKNKNSPADVLAASTTPLSAMAAVQWNPFSTTPPSAQTAVQAASSSMAAVQIERPASMATSQWNPFSTTPLSAETAVQAASSPTIAAVQAEPPYSMATSQWNPFSTTPLSAETAVQAASSSMAAVQIERPASMATSQWNPFSTTPPSAETAVQAETTLSTAAAQWDQFETQVEAQVDTKSLFENLAAQWDQVAAQADTESSFEDPAATGTQFPDIDDNPMPSFLVSPMLPLPEESHLFGPYTDYSSSIWQNIESKTFF